MEVEQTEFMDEVRRMLFRGVIDPKRVLMVFGGSGGSTLRRLQEMGIQDVETIAVNTDAISMRDINADKKIVIGRTITKGCGAGGHPEVGEKAAELAREHIENALEGADIVFLTGCLGGGTATGAMPVVAGVAKELNAFVIAMPIMPFTCEAETRMENAERCATRLKSIADITIVLDNDRLLRFGDNIGVNTGFQIMDRLIYKMVTSISELVSRSLYSALADDFENILNDVAAKFAVPETSEEEITAENEIVEPILADACSVEYDWSSLEDTGGMFPR